VLSKEFGDLAILEEDKRYLERWAARLDTGMAWAEDRRRAPLTGWRP
jgi:3-phenylpropionate/cinnamic acid dioxygenase small subunit